MKRLVEWKIWSDSQWICLLVRRMAREKLKGLEEEDEVRRILPPLIWGT